MAINIVVCSHPRSGTNWFKNELVSRGYYECNEWLHLTNSIYNDQFEPRVAVAKHEDRDFGLKLFPDHLIERDWSWEHFLSLLPHDNTAFIRINRLDIQAAARSWSGADIGPDDKVWFSSSQYLCDESTVPSYVERIQSIEKYWDDVLRGNCFYFTLEHMVLDINQQLDDTIDYIERVRSL